MPHTPDLQNKVRWTFASQVCSDFQISQQNLLYSKSVTFNNFLFPVNEIFKSMITDHAETNYTESINLLKRAGNPLFGKVIMVFLSFIMEN